MDLGGWIGLAMNGVIGVAFTAVAVVLVINAVKTHHVRNNPLGVATVILYLTCGGGHIVHFVQLLDVPTGHITAAGLAIQGEYATGWHMWAIDIVTAIAGVTYWTMRGRFPALVSGAAVFEDLRIRQRRAVEINDNIVQGLAHAKLAFDLGQDQEAEKAVAATLDKARTIITELLGERPVKPGNLRRQEASEIGSPRPVGIPLNPPKGGKPHA